jgi:hypothetical protein
MATRTRRCLVLFDRPVPLVDFLVQRNYVVPVEPRTAPPETLTNGYPSTKGSTRESSEPDCQPVVHFR